MNIISNINLYNKFVDSGVPGVSGVAVVGPVEEDGPQGPETVILLTASMGMHVSLKAVTIFLVMVRLEVILN